MRGREAHIYVWKILEGIVPKFCVESYSNNRTMRYCMMPNIAIEIQNKLLQRLEFQGLKALQYPLPKPERFAKCGYRSLRNNIGSSPLTSSG